MLERLIERAFVAACKAAGFWAVKLKALGFAGFPDRLVLCPGGRVRFVELKATGKQPTKLQCAVHKRLRALGFEVHVIDNREDARNLVAQWSLE